MVNQLEHATEALRKALVQVERLKTQNRSLLERSGEPIAVVGMSCRYPGWRRLPGEPVADGGRAARRRVRVSRRPRLGRRRPVRSRPRRTGQVVCHLRWLRRRRRPTSTPASSGSRPARRSRWTRSSGMLLELSWEALERAGIDPTVVAGQCDRRVRRRHRRRLRHVRRRHRGLPADRHDLERHVGPRRVRARASRARRCPSTPRVRRRWWRCTWRCRRCASANATWRWPAA